MNDDDMREHPTVIDAELIVDHLAWRLEALAGFCDHCASLLPRVGIHDLYWADLQAELERRGIR